MSGWWRRDIGKWSRKAGPAIKLPRRRPQSGRPKPCRPAVLLTIGTGFRRAKVSSRLKSYRKTSAQVFLDLADCQSLAIPTEFARYTLKAREIGKHVKKTTPLRLRTAMSVWCPRKWKTHFTWISVMKPHLGHSSGE